VFETGDEVVTGLTAFARAHDLDAGQLTAIGAFSDVTVILVESPAHLRRRPDAESGLALIDLDA
jgi:predicted DNA-binding protein with PD1-like motif